MVWLKQKWW